MMRALSETIFAVEPTSPGLTLRRILMSNRTCVIVALCLACAFALVACGGGAENANHSNSNAANTNRASTTSSAPTPAATVSAAAGDKIGVAECDDYLAKLDSCVSNKVPEAARAQYRTNLETTRKSWRDLAANPQTRSTLATACKQAVESARAAYKGFGCEF